MLWLYRFVADIWTNVYETDDKDNDGHTAGRGFFTMRNGNAINIAFSVCSVLVLINQLKKFLRKPSWISRPSGYNGIWNELVVGDIFAKQKLDGESDIKTNIKPRYCRRSVSQ